MSETPKPTSAEKAGAETMLREKLQQRVNQAFDEIALAKREMAKERKNRNPELTKRLRLNLRNANAARVKAQEELAAAQSRYFAILQREDLADELAAAGEYTGDWQYAPLTDLQNRVDRLFAARTRNKNSKEFAETLGNLEADTLAAAPSCIRSCKRCGEILDTATFDAEHTNCYNCGTPHPEI